MSAIYRCGGCHRTLDNPMVEVVRINGLGGAIPAEPNRPDHLCEDCTLYAYGGLRERREALAANR